MNYQKILNKIAEENNTSPQNVENEMKIAIKSAGYDMEPEIFIALVTAKVNSRIKK